MSWIVRARIVASLVLVVGLAVTIAAPVLALRGAEGAAHVATATTSATAIPTPASTASLAESWNAVQSELTGRPGLVVVPVGGSAEDALRFGEAPGGLAWSTAKVPITLAADLARPDSAEVDALIDAALRDSDNEAAVALWNGLGTSTQARAQVDAVLAAAGDTTTRIGQNEALGATTYGYTTWRLADQAVFAAGIACQPQAAPVVTAMTEVAEEQRWGLGTLPGAAFKGGWGPYGAGYTSRQFGLVPVGGVLGPDAPTLAVAMTVEDPQGDGTAELAAMAGWVARHLDQLPAGTC